MLEISGIGVLAAFGAGAISFLSPCVLPLVPAYVSYVTGKDLDDLRVSRTARLRTLLTTVPFVLGFSTIFMLLGLGAGSLGKLLLVHKREAEMVGGVIVIVFGLFMLGAIKIPLLQRDTRWHLPATKGRPLGAYILGVAFGAGWTPCIGPVLGAILTIGATEATGGAVVLLAIYSLGLGVAFMLVALFTGTFLRNRTIVARWGRTLHKGSGLVMVVFGLLMAFGQLELIANWMLNAFPIFTHIG